MRVFIIYSGNYRPIIKFIHKLFKDNVEILFDEDIKLGKNLKEEIFKLIDKADMVLCFISINMIYTDFCIEELKYAMEQNKIVIPIFIDISPEFIKQFKSPICDLRYELGLDLTNIKNITPQVKFRLNAKL